MPSRKHFPDAPITVVRYVGDGAYIAGVPARDLTPDEWAALPDDVQALALTPPLYILERGESAPVPGEFTDG